MTGSSLNIKSRGFTLIELLVVISIIGLLSSITLSSVRIARDKALVAKAKSDINQIVLAIIYAQGERNQRLVNFAPNSNWTAVACTAGGNVPTSPTCYNRVNAAMTEIENATNGSYTNLPRRDPWGIPYQMDANYGENVGGNFCNPDNIYLVFPNGTTRTITGLRAIPKEPKYPGC